MGPLQSGDTAGHFWSLSIEEQFYLVWPCLLLLVGPRRCRWIAAMAAVGIAAFRWLAWQHYQDGLLANRTEIRADALLLGCLLALLLSSRTIRRHAARWSGFCAIPAAAALCVAMVRFHLLQPLWESASIAMLLAATMLNPGSIPSRVLAWKPLAWLGTVSYSLYIWQAPFMGYNPSPLIFALSVGVGLPLFAVASYYFIERPCTRFGHRITALKHDPNVSAGLAWAGSTNLPEAN